MRQQFSPYPLRLCDNELFKDRYLGHFSAEYYVILLTHTPSLYTTNQRSVIIRVLWGPKHAINSRHSFTWGTLWKNNKTDKLGILIFLPWASTESPFAWRGNQSVFGRDIFMSLKEKLWHYTEFIIIKSTLKYYQKVDNFSLTYNYNRWSCSR